MISPFRFNGLKLSCDQISGVAIDHISPIRLARDERSMVTRLRQVTIEYLPPPPLPPTRTLLLLIYVQQLRKLSKEQEEFQLKASVDKQRLEQTKSDLVDLQTALDVERASRSSRERDVNALATNVAREHTSLEEMKGDLYVAREDRRRLESQASTVLDH